MQMLGLACVVAALMAAPLAAVPASPPSTRQLHTCAGYCNGDGKLSYQVGSTYMYEYRAPMSISVQGASNDESRLQLTATVHIHVKSACNLIMQLHNVTLQDSVSDEHSPVTRSADFSAALERHALMFAFHDGVIAELCASALDPAWVLNIKRGVLSMFQNSMRRREEDHRVYETDVVGDCDTEYKIVLGRGTGTTLFQRTKNPAACSRPMDNMSIITSENTCYISYEDGTLLMAVCNEVHQFRPFSGDESGAVTRLQQNLLRTGVVSGQATHIIGETTRTTLLYQHDTSEQESWVRANTIVAMLDEMKRRTADGVDDQVPRIFSSLVAALRTTAYPTLARVFSQTREHSTR